MKRSIISDESGRRAIETRKENVLELSGKGLRSMSSLPKRYSMCELILDNNSITKIEKLDVFPKLSSLSMVGNHLVRMNGINFAKNLKSVNLSNNGIVSMEGLCWLVHLEYLDLSKNNIKRIQNVSYCTKLKHMDLSENSITDISNLKSLVQLEVLLLHGNTITALERMDEKLPEQIETLSLSGNGIPDLNEVCHLSCLLNLKHFSVMDNPCVMTTSSLPGFNFRPFILSCLPSLLTLDGSVVTDNERQEAERLSRDENLPLFTFGHHLQLVLYLSKICPVSDTSEISKDQSDFLEDFLQKRRMEIFGDQKNACPLNNIYNSEGRHVNASDTLQSSSYSVLDFSTQNGSGNFSPDEESETDTLRSESRFLPVYSPLKKSPGINHRQFQTSLSWEVLPPNNTEDLPNMADDLTSMSEDLPIMSEEEANKLINLAATILQSHIRGFLVRRKFDYRNFKRMHIAASKVQALWRGYYFRHHSNQGLNFKNELRVRRLQNYISTLFLIMQKSEKQHEIEKQQMLEIITLLYEKFTQLSKNVEKLESSTNEGNKMESDESRNGLEETLHTLFIPHPRLSRNTEQREDKGNTDEGSSNAREFPVCEDVGCDLKVDKDSKVVIRLSEDVDSINNKMFDKASDDATEFHGGNVEVDHLDLGAPKQDIVEKRETLMDQEDHSEWNKKVQKVEGDRVEENKILDQEYDPHWDKESGKCEDSIENGDVENDKECYSEGVTKWNDNEEGTKEDSFAHKTSETPDDELSTDIPEDFAENGTMSSEMNEAFMTADVCELLKTVESDKKQGVDETFRRIERFPGDSMTREVFKSLDVVTDNLSVSGSGSVNGEDRQVNDDDLGEQFDNGKPSCSNIENDQELKSDITTGECDKLVLTSLEENVMEEKVCVNGTKELDTDGKGDPVINDQNTILQQLPLEVTPNNDNGNLEDCSRDTEQKPISNHLSAKDGTEYVAKFAVVGDKDNELVPNSSKDDDNVGGHALNPSDIENKVADKFKEHGESSGGVHRQFEESQQEVYATVLSSEGRTTESENKEDFNTNEARCSEVNMKGNNNEDKSMEDDNSEHFGKELTLGGGFVSKVDELIEATGCSEFCIVEGTRIKVGEETELPYKNEEVVEKPAMTSHGRTEKRSDDYITGESLKDSLDQTDQMMRHKDETIVDFTGDVEEVITGEEIVYNNAEQSSADVKNKISMMANVENEMANVESNNGSCDELQHSDIEVPQSNRIEMENSIKESITHDEVSGSGNLEQETVTENTSETEVTKISPRLRERASSLLSALKDEITGVGSNDNQSEQSSACLTSPAISSGGDVDGAKDTEFPLLKPKK